MTKNDWFNIKEKGEITVEALYEFWKNNKKPSYKDLTLEEFAEKIQSYINSGGSIFANKIIEYFDKTFFLTKVFDKDKNLIKEL